MNTYGKCPQCGTDSISRERRPNGNDKCANGHTYPSANAIQSHSGVEAVGRIERNSSSKYTFIFNDEYIGEGKLLADGTELYLANPDQSVRVKEQQAEITRLNAIIADMQQKPHQSETGN